MTTLASCEGNKYFGSTQLSPRSWIFAVSTAQVHSKPSQISKMDVLAKTVFLSLIVFTKTLTDFCLRLWTDWSFYHVCLKQSLGEKCPYSEFFWSAFFRIWTVSREIRCISPYSVQMQKNADQKNSEYGRFSRSEYVPSRHWKKAIVSRIRFVSFPFDSTAQTVLQWLAILCNYIYPFENWNPASSLSNFFVGCEI